MPWDYQTMKYEPGGLLGGKVDYSRLTAELNKMGADGWELVSAFDTNYSEGATREIVMIFKRAR